MSWKGAYVPTYIVLLLGLCLGPECQISGLFNKIVASKCLLCAKNSRKLVDQCKCYLWKLQLQYIIVKLSPYNNCVDGTVFCQGLRNPSSNSGRFKEFFSFPKCPHRLWGSSNFLFSWYTVSFPGLKRMGREVYYQRRGQERMEFYLALL